MKILFIGGSGVISRAATEQTIAAGHELWLLNRGKRRPVDGARVLVADIADVEGTKAALRGHSWDLVVQWIAFVPADIRRDLELFRGKTRQYIFISSASVYEKPLTHYLITEETPLANPHWEYSRLKIACEQELRAAYRDTGFPAVIVRPSLTYGEDQVPLVLNACRRVGRPSSACDEAYRSSFPAMAHRCGPSLTTRILQRGCWACLAIQLRTVRRFTSPRTRF